MWCLQFTTQELNKIMENRGNNLKFFVQRKQPTTATVGVHGLKTGRVSHNFLRGGAKHYGPNLAENRLRQILLHK